MNQSLAEARRAYAAKAWRRHPLGPFGCNLSGQRGAQTAWGPGTSSS
jgi:hypothetical protein